MTVTVIRVTQVLKSNQLTIRHSFFCVFVFPTKLKVSILKKKNTPSFSNLVFKEIPPTFRSKRYFIPFYTYTKC